MSFFMGRWSSGSRLEVITLVAVVLGVGAGLAFLLCSTSSSTKDETLDGLDLFLFGI